MENLYIIGNGFDLYHNLDTRYQNFARYLSKSYSELYDLILKYYYLPDLTIVDVSNEDYNLWSDFEVALANLDYEYVLEENSNYAANLSDPDFRDSDWHSYEYEMMTIVEKLTTKLKEAFRKFILDIDYNINVNGKLINIENRSFFLNFNYTDSLEKYYSIPKKSILYIHNKASDLDRELILGHGTDPNDFEKDNFNEPPENLTEEELERWEDEMRDQYEYSYESAKSKILSYYLDSFKDSENIIKENSSFFLSLGETRRIYILGHSISDVDIRYFEVLIENLDKSVKWFISYNNPETKQARKNILKNLGIIEENIHLIQIKDLIKNID